MMKTKTIVSSVGAAAAVAAILSPTTSVHAASASSELTVVANVVSTWTDNFNPFSTSSMGGTDGNIYETLFYFDNTTGKQFNLLGTSYKFSNGNKTLTVQLQKKAKWTDGQSFTAKDVVFTFNDLKKYSDADINGVWQQLTSVTAKGNYEVVFQFKSANIPFAEQYVLGDTYIVPEHEWNSLGDPAKAKIPYNKAIGTGPFMISSFATQDYKFTANKNYYGGAPKIQTLNYPAYGTNSAADLALASGQVQYAGVNIPDIQKTYVNADKAHNHYFFPPIDPVELFPNLNNPLLAQLPVREAISEAIDRNALSVKGESGYEGVASPTGLVLPQQNSWLDKSLPASELKFQVNDAKAEKLLESAGFKKDSNGIFAKSGKELSFQLLTVAGWSDFDEDALLIEQELGQIGIKISVSQQQFGAYQNLMNPGSGKNPKFELALGGTNTGPTPYTFYFDTFDSNGAGNNEVLKNATIDAALQNFSSTSSTSAQKKDIDVIEKYAVEQLPVIPLLNGALWYEYNDSGFTGWSTKSHLWINPSPYNYQSAAIIMDRLSPVK